MSGDSTSASVLEEKGELANEVDTLEQEARERRLVRKLDLWIFPCLVLSYLVTCLDVSISEYPLPRRLR